MQASGCVEEQISRWFSLPDDALRAIKSHIGRELDLGLRDEEAATIKMLITYVRELSRGDEMGSYLALDLGGTHFRVLLVQLNGPDGLEPKVTSVTHDIPHALLVTQNGHELFDYIAMKLLEFVQQYKLKRRRISLGFTFSFPCKQYGLTQSYLVKWCKGFNVGGVVNTDVVKQLKDALKRQLAGRVQAYIDVVAVLNDTTGTLVACANKHRDCRIGLIVGTGYNACYMERLDRCEKWPANYTAPKQVIVNCEWGAMGDHKERRELDPFRNELDREIDLKSVNPLNQTYEKMVGGMYVGEMLRLALLKLYSSKQLFHGQATSAGSSLSINSTSSSSSPSASSKSPASKRGGSSSSKSTRSKSSKSRSQLKCDPVACAQTPRSPLEGRNPGKSFTGATSNMSSNGRKSRKSLSCGAANNRNRSSKSSSSRSKRMDAKQAAEIVMAANASHKLHVKDILNGRHLSLLAQDELAGTHNETTRIMHELSINHFSEHDLQVVIRLGAVIMRRGAHLVASGISALLERLGRSFTIIGYDGSLVKYHPYFLKLIIEKTSVLTPKELKFEFVQSSDGSGIGAAVVAAALHKERRPLYIVKPGKLYEMHFMRTQMIQSQLSLEGSVANRPNTMPGTELVGSASSRTSTATSSPAPSTAGAPPVGQSKTPPPPASPDQQQQQQADDKS